MSKPDQRKKRLERDLAMWLGRLRRAEERSRAADKDIKDAEHAAQRIRFELAVLSNEQGEARQ